MYNFKKASWHEGLTAFCSPEGASLPSKGKMALIIALFSSRHGYS